MDGRGVGDTSTRGSSNFGGGGAGGAAREVGNEVDGKTWRSTNGMLSMSRLDPGGCMGLVEARRREESGSGGSVIPIKSGNSSRAFSRTCVYGAAKIEGK